MGGHFTNAQGDQMTKGGKVTGTTGSGDILFVVLQGFSFLRRLIQMVMGDGCFKSMNYIYFPKSPPFLLLFLWNGS